MKNIKSFLEDNVVGVGIVLAILLIIFLSTTLSNDMEEHIERVSKECASQGYGITAKYTKEGDKYYVCNK